MIKGMSRSKGLEGTSRGTSFEGKGKGHEQHLHRNEGDSHGSLVYHQKPPGLDQFKHSYGNKLSDLEQHQKIGSDPALHESSSIFSSTPFVQPTWEYDFRQIFSDTPIVQLVDSMSNPFLLQRCHFRDINSKRVSRTTHKSIFKGKEIVQPAKPFFLNPQFHDRRSQLTSKYPYFEKGESSHHR